MEERLLIDKGEASALAGYLTHLLELRNQMGLYTKIPYAEELQHRLESFSKVKVLT